MPQTVLVTGATGNVGSYVVQYLVDRDIDVIATSRRMEPKQSHKNNPRLKFVKFNFLDVSTFDEAIAGVDAIFLVRPPPMDNASEFKPFLDHAVSNGVTHIVFLSLLGINPLTPHFKIERLIKSYDISYTFLRAGFFMQNLLTTHLRDITENDEIYIPAGGGKTSFIDVRDIAEVAAQILKNGSYQNTVLKLTGPSKLKYNEVAEILTKVTSRDISYSNPSTMEFRQRMSSYGLNEEYIDVMINLYRIVKFRLAGKVTTDVSKILGRSPRTFMEFAMDHSGKF